MRILTGPTFTPYCRIYCPCPYETIAIHFWTSGAGTVTVMLVISVFEHVLVTESRSIHWPGEYPPTPPSPRSSNTFQKSRYRNRTVCGWVIESRSQNNARNANDKPPSWVHHLPVGKTWFTRGRVQGLKNAYKSVTVQNQTHVYMKLFDHKT